MARIIEIDGITTAAPDWAVAWNKKEAEWVETVGTAWIIEQADPSALVWVVDDGCHSSDCSQCPSLEKCYSDEYEAWLQEQDAQMDRELQGESM